MTALVKRVAAVAAAPPKTMTAVSALLSRRAFRTSRLLDFCNRRELIAQTGHQVEDWPLVIVKGLKVQLQTYLERHPELAWDEALAQIIGGQNGRDVLG